MASVKWLRSITAIAEPFEGVQQTLLYRYRRTEDEAGDAGHAPAAPRADGAARDPGVPLARSPRAPPAARRSQGRAWSGHGPICRVEFSADGGRTWADARLGQPAAEHGWAGWSYDWHAAETGDYELCVRATDAPATPSRSTSPTTWNQGGYAVNAVQRVAVRVG